ARNRSRARPSRLSSRAILVKLRWPCLHLQRVASWANLKLTIRSSRRRFAARLNSGVRPHMPFFAKLAIFFSALFGTIWLIRRFPHHPVSQFAVKWHGPFPTQDELFSKFMARRALYTFKWFCQVLVAFCALWLLVSWRP